MGFLVKPHRCNTGRPRPAPRHPFELTSEQAYRLVGIVHEAARRAGTFGKGRRRARDFNNHGAPDEWIDPPAWVQLTGAEAAAGRARKGAASAVERRSRAVTAPPAAPPSGQGMKKAVTGWNRGGQGSESAQEVWLGLTPESGLFYSWGATPVSSVSIRCGTCRSLRGVGLARFSYSLCQGLELTESMEEPSTSPEMPYLFKTSFTIP